MVAQKPNVKQSASKNKAPIPVILIGIILLGVAWMTFSKGHSAGENGDPKLSPEAEEKLEKRLREIDDSEQYALVAVSDGWYPCLHSGRTICYLRAGEIWKYGVTSKGQFRRYSAAFLVRNRVSYIVQFKGTLSECLKQEQIRLFHYPTLPENLARPVKDRLPRPPYNPIMR